MGGAPEVVVGISAHLHDAAAAVVVGGEILAAAEEERFSRVKHDASLPRRAVASCLATAAVPVDDVDAVVFYELPLNGLARWYATRQRQGPRGVPTFARQLGPVLRRQLGVAARIDDLFRDLGRDTPVPVRFVEHHLSHAAAAFLPSPFEHAAILTVDGLGEWTTATVGRGAGHTLEVLQELRFPDSLGLLYALVTASCGFRPNGDEYKIMGLAPYGAPTYVEQLQQLAQLGDDGSVRVRGARVDWFSGRSHERRRVRALLGPPRPADQPVGAREADLAASVQALTEQALLGMARTARDLTGEQHLCLAGGVALNSAAMGRLRREGLFERVWVQPAAGDAGSAVGAALALYHRASPEVPRRRASDDAMAGAFLGPAVRGDEVDRWVAERGLDTLVLDDPERRCDHVAQRLANGAVVGWFSGRMEFGPRALGHRSILADPRPATTRERLNAHVKGRESFRPFAPAVLAERAADWFELDGESPYMSFVVPVRPEHLVPVEEEPATIEQRARVVRSSVPACTHVDGTARVQTVDAGRNPALHRLLAAFDRLTGCPVLVNTSFNRAGEPIVATPDQALATARAGGIDVLVVEHHVLELA